jgi:hypothetical protein
MYVGNQVVGHVTKGEKFLVVKLQDGWISLKTEDGTAIAGWIKNTGIRLISP